MPIWPQDRELPGVQHVKRDHTRSQLVDDVLVEGRHHVPFETSCLRAVQLEVAHVVQWFVVIPAGLVSWHGKTKNVPVFAPTSREPLQPCRKVIKALAELIEVCAVQAGVGHEQRRL
eukprot:CAMPEP_0171114662 /NCGR_PEP_ID=MMETSP0766_2-20121228/85834_1 /TAXON_ID=439317 /ORGANISM="Gambierdiscus australes, Strain CAWD 149" /LENGTH=116 /DNA_ID=CAMNT_0011576963 /DNA_START=135 /DNA_END=485 /DNA_ORIENTATION=-